MSCRCLPMKRHSHLWELPAEGHSTIGRLRRRIPRPYRAEGAERSSPGAGPPNGIGSRLVAGWTKPVAFEPGRHRDIERRHRPIAEDRGWSYARWSPSGDWVSYVTTQWRAALLNLRTHETKIIDPSAKMAWEMEWSPDGKFLLLAETGDTYFGFEWVYRISDGAYCPLHDLGGFPARIGSR